MLAFSSSSAPGAVLTTKRSAHVITTHADGRMDHYIQYPSTNPSWEYAISATQPDGQDSHDNYKHHGFSVWLFVIYDGIGKGGDDNCD